MNQAATSAQKSAVVFAYHNVGVRCLSVLLAGGVDIRLVVTHQDDPKEEVWFESVATIAARHGIPIMTPIPLACSVVCNHGRLGNLQFNKKKQI